MLQARWHRSFWDLFLLRVRPDSHSFLAAFCAVVFTLSVTVASKLKFGLAAAAERDRRDAETPGAAAAPGGGGGGREPAKQRRGGWLRRARSPDERRAAAAKQREVAGAAVRALIGAASYWLNVHFLSYLYSSYSPRAQEYYSAGVWCMVSTMPVSQSNPRPSQSFPHNPA